MASITPDGRARTILSSLFHEHRNRPAITPGITACGMGRKLVRRSRLCPFQPVRGEADFGMNYTLVTTAWQDFQIKAAYRHYDYNKHTPVHTFTPVQGDAAAPASEEENTPSV